MRRFPMELIDKLAEMLDLKVVDEKNREDLVEAVLTNYSLIKVIEDMALIPSDDPMFYVRYLEGMRAENEE